MDFRDPEYSAFGPWAIEISQEDPPPPLFVPYLTRPEEPLFSVKIPRNIERRDAVPGMNLYDYLVSLYEDDLVVLHRVGEDVEQESFFYRDIQYLRYGEYLLKGNLFLCTAEKSYDLPFNTTSRDVMQRLLNLIRERYIDGVGRMAMAEEPDIITGEMSYYFTRLLERERMQHPHSKLLAAQPDTYIGSYETSALRKLFLGAVSKTLLESFHLCDGRELIITGRGKAFKYRWQTEYGTDRHFIPVGNIRGASWLEDAQETAVLHLNLETAGRTASFAFVSDNPWIPTYDRFLKAVPEWESETRN